MSLYGKSLIHDERVRWSVADEFPGNCFPLRQQAAFRRWKRWQQFAHPHYTQCGTAPFIKGLSALDLLFNCGPRSGALLREASTVPDDERIAA